MTWQPEEYEGFIGIGHKIAMALLGQYLLAIYDNRIHNRCYAHQANPYQYLSSLQARKSIGLLLSRHPLPYQTLEFGCIGQGGAHSGGLWPPGGRLSMPAGTTKFTSM